MTNSLRERRKQQLRDDILDAARVLLNEKGFAAMSMDDVAAQAGISKPTLYSHFPTGKDAVVAAVVAREINRLLDITETGEVARTPLQQLTLILETVVRLQVRERRQPVRMWMPEFHRLICEHPEMMDAIRNLDQRIGSLVQEGVAQGEIDPALDVPTVVRTFYALVSALHFSPHSSIGEPNTAIAASSLATIFARGVQPAQPR